MSETCAHRMWGDADGLACTYAADHAGAHHYEASDAPDRHVEQEQP